MQVYCMNNFGLLESHLTVECLGFKSMLKGQYPLPGLTLKIYENLSVLISCNLFLFSIFNNTIPGNNPNLGENLCKCIT